MVPRRSPRALRAPFLTKLCAARAPRLSTFCATRAPLLIMLCLAGGAQRAQAQSAPSGQPALPGAPQTGAATSETGDAQAPHPDAPTGQASATDHAGTPPAAHPPSRISKPTPLATSHANAKPVPKVAPKPGPGAKDAGQAARLLRTSTLPLVSLIDRVVIGREKREIGHVIDVLVDMKGEPTALVVEVGGFMGMGNRRIAIAWERGTLVARRGGDALQLPFSDAQIRAAPAYTETGQVTVVEGAAEPTESGRPGGNAAADSNRVDLGLGPVSPADGSDTARDQLNPD